MKANFLTKAFLAKALLEKPFWANNILAQHLFAKNFSVSVVCLALLFVQISSSAQSLIRPNTKPLAPEYELHRDGSVSLRVCHNSSCAVQQAMNFTAQEMQSVIRQLQVCPNNPANYLQRARIAVWQMELLAKKHYPPLGNDLPVNDQEYGVEGRTDCVDNSTNTSTFLKVLQDLGQLPGWSVQAPSVRKAWDINRVHWTAVLKDSNNKLWSVDSWFRRHGHLPFMMPLENWQREELAWEGEHNRHNPYPDVISALCQ